MRTALAEPENRFRTVSWRLFRWVLGGSAVVAVTIGLLAQRPPAAQAQGPPAALAPASARAFEWKGVGSCAAMACHGGAGTAPSSANSYTIWMARDRHAQAYAILFDEPSQRIEAKLHGSGRVRAETDARCLECHVHPDEGRARHATTYTREDGVGCESCHGPAERWLEPHTRVSWKEMTDADKLALGMTPTKDLNVRAKLCVSCHVGGAGREVDHDLIAAGHPRLRFELGWYQTELPKHWDWAAEKRREPGLEARTWERGQVVTAQAALELLAARAREAAQDQTDSSKKTAGRAWPEFAEYDCFACHHDLAVPSWRQQHPPSDRPAGSLPWGTWSMSMIRLLDGPARGASGSSLRTLESRMADPYPDPAEVERLALKLHAELGAGGTHAGSARPALADVRSMLNQLTTSAEALSNPSWDIAAQLYLALAALAQAEADLGQEPHPEAAQALKDMVRLLDYPDGYDSPHGRGPFIPGKFEEALRRFEKRLGP